MLFSSMIFLWVFLPIVLIGNFLVNLIRFKNKRTKIRLKNCFLLMLSLAFYAWGGIYYLLLMLSSIAVNYFGALIMEKAAKTPAARKWTLIGTVIANLAMLFFFKYFNMTVTVIEAIMGPLPEGQSVLDAMINMQGTGRLSLPYIVLPIGISFFTFQAMSYVIDVYRGDAKLQTNVFDFALYVSLFPQLIAGPIVRYSDVALELEDRTESMELMVQGIKRFCYGIGKKVLLSNTFAVIADSIWSVEDTTTLGTAVAWYGIAAYTLQIYYDFSGYSDMAIGIGKMFGFHFKENFDYPYTSLSVQEFWRRWHISLSTWFREYVYIPLGGNRKGEFRTYLNLFIVWCLTGIWHGANFTFMAWGLFYAVLLIVERLFLGKLLKKNPVKIFNWIYTMLAVMIGWVYFRSNTITQANQFMGQLFSFTEGKGVYLTTYLSMQNIITFVVGILLCGLVQRPLQRVYNEKLKDKLPVLALDLLCQAVLLGLAIIMIISGTYNPFIYFQF